MGSPGRGTLDHSTFATSRTPRAMSSPLGSLTSLSLARATSHSSRCPRARVSSCPSPRRGTRGSASRPRFTLCPSFPCTDKLHAENKNCKPEKKKKKKKKKNPEKKKKKKKKKS